MIWHITACFYASKDMAYPALLEVEADGYASALARINDWTEKEWRLEFPEEIRSRISSARDIVITCVESEQDRKAREEALQAEQDALNAPPPPPPEPVKKRRGRKRK